MRAASGIRAPAHPLFALSPRSALMCHCGRPNQIYTYCRDHFIEAWWSGSAVKDNRAYDGMPDLDLRQVVAGEWEFSVSVIMADPDYIEKSRKFTLNKLTKGKLYRNADRPGTGMGHSYIRFKSPRLKGASRDYITFGMMSNGLTSPDGEAGKNPLHAELAIDYSIDDRQKDAICEAIGNWLAGHIMNDAKYRYDIMSSNCTRFAADCCAAAGVYFPGNRIPAYSRTSGWNRTYTPGKLYDAMKKSHYAYDPVRDRSPGTCPTGFIGFQKAKKSRGAAPAGQYEFRKELERFKSETGVRNEIDAAKLMAFVKRGTITLPDLKIALQNASSAQVLQGITNPV